MLRIALKWFCQSVQFLLGCQNNKFNKRSLTRCRLLRALNLPGDSNQPYQVDSRVQLSNALGRNIHHWPPGPLSTLKVRTNLCLDCAQRRMFCFLSSPKKSFFKFPPLLPSLPTARWPSFKLDLEANLKEGGQTKAYRLYIFEFKFPLHFGSKCWPREL